MDLKVVIMDEKLIAQNIKEEIFRKEFERYFHILEEGLNKEPYKSNINIRPHSYLLLARNTTD